MDEPPDSVAYGVGEERHERQKRNRVVRRIVTKLKLETLSHGGRNQIPIQAYGN
jgi:hypothetical protein